jgi:chromosome segregation ATPase
MGVVVVGLVVLPGAAAWGQAVGMTSQRVMRAPAESEMPAPERIDQLNRHREELAEMARLRQLELQELREARNARERELRAELVEIYEQMARVERNLAQIERQQEEAQRRLAARAENESARLAERIRNLQAQAEQMQQTLQELRDRGGEQREAVRRSLAETREQMRRLEMELRGLGAGPLVPATPRREEMLRPMREPQPQGEQLPRGRRRGGALPERQEMMIEPDRPVMEMQEQLGGIQMQLQQNTEKVDKLGDQVSRLNEGLTQTQEQINALMKPDCPSTVGSAGYGYGWHPNFRPYYLY